MELNCIIFPQVRAKVSMEAILNGKLAYIPKLNKIIDEYEDEEVPSSPKSSLPSEMMAKYPAQSFKATKNIAFEKKRIRPQEVMTSPSSHCISTEESEEKYKVKKTHIKMEQINLCYAKIQSDDFSQLSETDFSDSDSKLTVCESPSSFREQTVENRMEIMKYSKKYEQKIDLFEIDDIKSEKYIQTHREIIHSYNKLGNESSINKMTQSTFSNIRVNSNNSNIHRMSVPNTIYTRKLNDSLFMGYDIEMHKPCGYVPVFYLESKKQSENLLVYFHGNGDDCFSSYPLLNHLRTMLEVNVISVEYPGYGHYKSSTKCTAETITEDAEYVLDFMTTQLKFDLKNIILLGRSLGTGPATYLASKYEVGALALISAFTSIRGVFGEFTGFLKYMVKERFNNLENIKKVTCPTFLLHGKSDTLISYKHSIALSENCNCVCEVNTPNKMNHREFDYTDDLSLPLVNFLHRNKYKLGNINPNRRPLPEGLTYHPSQLKK